MGTDAAAAAAEKARERNELRTEKTGARAERRLADGKALRLGRAGRVLAAASVLLLACAVLATGVAAHEASGEPSMLPVPPGYRVFEYAPYYDAGVGAVDFHVWVIFGSFAGSVLLFVAGSTCFVERGY